MVVFRKFIEIENPRLDALSWTLWALYIGGFAFLAWWSETWKSSFSVSSAVWLRTYSDDTTTENYPKLKESFETAMNTDLCQDPSQYDFWFDDAGSRKLADFTCAKLCQRDELKSDCLSRRQVVHFPEYGQADFLTYVEDHGFKTNGATAPVSRRILPWAADSLSIRIVYGMEVRSHSTINAFYRTKETTSYSIYDNILTVILNAKGEVVKHFKPSSDSLKFVVQDMLDWSQESGRFDLDDPTHGSNAQNYKSGGFPTGPTPRLSGGSLYARIQCYNSLQRKITIDIDWTGVLCTVQFQFSTKLSESFHSLAPIDGDGQSAERNFRAITVRFEANGEFQFVSVLAVAFLVIQFLLLTRIPKALTWFITSRCLGKYSEIYRKAAVHELDLIQECKGCAARTMCHNICYSQLQERETNVRVTGGLQKDMIAKVISQTIAPKLNGDAPLAREAIEREEAEIMKHKRMTPELLRQKSDLFKRKKQLKKDNEKSFHRKAVQAKGILDFCYQSMVSKKSDSRSSLSEEMAILWRPVKIDELDEPEDGVTMSQFVNACASEDLVSLKDLAALFDGERPMGILENFFASRQIRAYQEYAKNNLATESETITCYFESQFGENPTAGIKRAEETLRQTPHSRMDRVLYRLKEIEEMISSGKAVKPPIVVQLPAMLHLDKGDEKVIIDIKLNRRCGDNLGLQVAVARNEERNTSSALITNVDDTSGLAVEWNDEHDRDMWFEIGDVILSVNGIEDSFIRIEQEMHTNQILEIKLEKTGKKKAHNPNDPGAHDNSSEDPAAIEDLIKDQDRLIIEAQRGIEENRAKITKLSNDAKDAENTRDQLKACLDELQVLFARKPYEIDVVTSLILGKPFCQSCGTAYTQHDGRKCSHCGRSRKDLQDNDVFTIPDPAEGTYDVLVDGVIKFGVHRNRLRNLNKEERSMQVGDRVKVRGPGSAQGMSLLRQTPDFADWTPGVITSVAPIAVQPDGWQFSYFFDHVDTHEEVDRRSSIAATSEVFLKGEKVEYCLDLERHEEEGNWVIATVDSESEHPDLARATIFCLSTKELEQPAILDPAPELQSNLEPELEPKSFGAFESQYYSNISRALRMPSPGITQKQVSKQISPQS